MATILVVEDDKLLGKSLGEVLEEAGYEVFWALEAGQVFEALKVRKVDLIFLDIMLPGKDGYQILRELKADGAYRSIPVVVLSNLGQSAEIDKALGLGAKDYVVKANIDLDGLVGLVKSKYLPQ